MLKVKIKKKQLWPNCCLVVCMWMIKTPVSQTFCPATGTPAVITAADSHQVKLGGLLRGAPRWPRLAVALVFVGVHKGEDDEERVMRVLQTRSADQLRAQRAENICCCAGAESDGALMWEGPHAAEDVLEARVLRGHSRCLLCPHASRQLVHERQELVGRDILHPLLEGTTMVPTPRRQDPIRFNNKYNKQSEVWTHLLMQWLRTTQKIKLSYRELLETDMQKPSDSKSWWSTFTMSLTAFTSALPSHSEARRNTQVSCSSPSSRHWM